MAKKTAVQWLIDELHDISKTEGYSLGLKEQESKLAMQQALSLEREQQQKDYLEGRKDGYKYNGFADYFNQNYGDD